MGHFAIGHVRLAPNRRKDENETIVLNQIFVVQIKIQQL